MTHKFRAVAAAAALLAAGCGGSGSSAAIPGDSNRISVRFVEGAPVLETLVNGVPTSIGEAYLAVDAETIASSFPYGDVTPFVTRPAGVQSIEARDSLGYSVGPLKTDALPAGKSYTVVVAGTYPNYRALAFLETAGDGGASLAVYEASPAYPVADFGTFRASRGNGFKKLGSVRLGNVAAVSLGRTVANLGAYAGKGTVPIGTLTVRAVNQFDQRNALPFHSASRFSIFLLDPAAGSGGPLFGSLDQ
ncbi:MAG TPA: DUF4397 domain-containing protein [Candidatus Tumulicola sp.]|nr:DUF4397 domain-containing protein [Candidatus Tumulicola sp.]